MAVAQAQAIEAEAQESQTEAYHRYRFRCDLYVEELGTVLWSGIDGEPGFREICNHVNLVIRQLDERSRFHRGQLATEALTVWEPGQVIENRIQLPGCHGSGKTRLVADLCNWFFDAWGPCIIETFAPSAASVNDLLWKEIRDGRERGDLTPRAQAVPSLKASAKWFARGRATSDAGGKGRERIHGQHADRMLFVFDEAEGIPDFVWIATKTMMAGDFVLIFEMANPRTRTSRFHKTRGAPNVKRLRLNGLYHPNVFHGRTVVPGGAISRGWVEDMVREHCTEVHQHDEDLHTFELPWRPGVIYKPDSDFLYQVLALAPANMEDNTAVPVGRYEAAVERGRDLLAGRFAFERGAFPAGRVQFGLDVARWGRDNGTLYVFWKGMAWRERAWPQSDSYDYLDALLPLCRELRDQGVTAAHFRLDSVGVGAGAFDVLIHSQELRDIFDEVVFIEFNGSSRDLPGDLDEQWLDLNTAVYMAASEMLKVIALIDPPEHLEEDLTERRLKGTMYQERWIKKLESKDDFKKKHEGRSPDDGDGLVLAICPIEVLQPQEVKADPILF